MDDTDYEEVYVYRITQYETERTEENWYQPYAEYYVEKSSGSIYLFDTNSGSLIPQ